MIAEAVRDVVGPEAVTPFRLHVPQAEIDRLHRKLDDTRWPDDGPVGDWSQGVPRPSLQRLCAYWRHEYDWRRCENWLNAVGQFQTEIDGLAIHFLHVRSPSPTARPLLLTHGWPGSVLEFRHVIGPLTDPAAHGGDPDDAFHLVIPSLPGFGFSASPAAEGWDLGRIAEAWAVLMNRLGYNRWFAQGGDWGSVITRMIGERSLGGCIGVHMNMAFAQPRPEDMDSLTPAEQAFLAQAAHYDQQESAYARLQSTRPQTLGYALTDSPVGQAAWIYEKLRSWTDNDGEPEDALAVDEILDNIMLYWLPARAASSARLYWEGFSQAFALPTGEGVPTGISIYPRDILRTSRRLYEGVGVKVAFWREHTRGGHFAAWEEPDLFVADMRDCFGALR